MAFEVFLSTEEETEIFIANPHCNAISPSFEECIATAAITASTARFNFFLFLWRTNYSHTMRSFLPEKIKSIYPNPARQIITVELNSL